VISIQINGVPLPIVESDYGVRLNKKAFDLDNINRRWGDWSKSVVVASSPQSDSLFNSLFNVNIDIKNTSEENFNPDFNPNLIADCNIFVDGIPVLNGHAQLTKITIDSQHKIVYHLNCYSSFKSFFEKIEDKYLEDIDISDNDHTYSISNITGSWSSSGYADSPGYVYPMIDYGKQHQSDWADSDFKPAVFTKQLVDKIFSNAGYTYTSSFFDSDLFDKLIHPSEYNIDLSDSQIRLREFYVGRSTSDQTVSCYSPKNAFTTTAALTDQLIFNDDTSPYKNTDGNKYSTTNGVFTPATWNGRYKFRGKIKSTLQMDATYPGVAIAKSGITVYADISVYVLLINNDTSQSTIAQKIPINGYEFSGPLIFSSTSSSKTIFFDTNIVSVKTFHSVALVPIVEKVYYTLTTTRNGKTKTRQVVYAGDYFDKSATNSYINFKLETTSEFGSQLAETKVQIGDTVQMSQVIPKEVKQKDYIVSLFEMFNLYSIPDPNNQNNLIIETRDDFFTDEKEDITQLLDVSKEQELEPMALLRATRYEWSYRDDNDIYNKQYKYMWQEDYGMYRRDVQNEFVYDTKKISILFAPTPIVNYPKSDYSVGNDRIISAIVFEDAKDGKNTSKQTPRILYWGGLLDTNDPWRLFWVNSSTPYTLQYKYPYAGHLDNPYNPFIDLSFGTPRAVFYDNNIGGIQDITYLDANLYNVYWKRWMDEITDKNSKVLTCYIKLDPLSYSNLSFRKLYFIGDATYRLLEVSDYDMMGGSTTKCKFLKWNPYNQHFVARKNFNGGRDTIGDGDDPTPGFMRVLTGNQLGRYSDSFRLNNADDIPYIKGFVYGDGNTVGGVRNSLIYSDNNEVRGDNVLLVNTSNRIVNGGDQIWMNDIFAEKYIEIVFTSTDIGNMFGGYLQVLGKLPSDQYYKVNRVLSFYDYNGTAYPFGGEFVISTDTSYSTLATGNGAISGSADVYLNWTIGTEAIDFSEGLVITNNVEDTGAGGDLTLKIYYQIIEF